MSMFPAVDTAIALDTGHGRNHSSRKKSIFPHTRRWIQTLFFALAAALALAGNRLAGRTALCICLMLRSQVCIGYSLGAG